MKASKPLLHHLALRSGDVPGLARFYGEMLGLEVVRDLLPRSLWLGLGAGAVLMIEARGAGEPSPSPSSMELVALRVVDDDKAEVRRRAVAAGCFDGETEFTVYLRDPEGRRIGVSTFDFDDPAG